MLRTIQTKLHKAVVKYHVTKKMITGTDRTRQGTNRKPWSWVSQIYVTNKI